LTDLPTAAPYGSWASPITAARIVEGAASVNELRADGPDVWWSEGRPSEAGRTQLVRRTADGARHDVLPEGWNARTQVHEYGGGAWTVRDGVVWFSAWADQRLYRLDAGAGQAVPQPVTPNPIEPRALRYADADLSPDGRWLVCVRERHEPREGQHAHEVVNEIVVLPASPGEDVGEPVEPTVLVTGPDFVSSPRISPDGTRLAWLQWDHPDMPWDRTGLQWAAFEPERGPVEGELVAGGPAESIVQPTWTDGGGLLAASDRTGWWNVYRFTGGDLVLDDPDPLTPIDAEIGGPHWVFGQSWFTVLPDSTLVVSLGADGLQSVGVVPAGSGRVERLETPYTAVGQLRSLGDAEFAMVAAGPRDEATPLRCRFAAEGVLETEVLRPGRDLGIDPATFSTPEPIEFPTTGDRTAHALLYRPTNPDVVGLPDALPPLLVLSHGGPTSAARPILSLGTQFWTSRGFAVVDVNYGGSTGYGRPYRERLQGTWGIVDVDDCVAAAEHLAREGLVDPERLAIRGGSAGGYTTLCALAFRDTFQAGASHYGVADCEALARDTHKFESRYLDGLIGPYPAEVELYRERSPIHHTDGFACPLIVFQGLEDEVVPPAQAEMIVDALRAKGMPVAYVPFAGEQHGFRQAPNIVRSLEAELWFYGKVFGFDPADQIEPVTDAFTL
jgi:dipeptidyl aminopeptidase/acylaminoacyl peptidase